MQHRIAVIAVAVALALGGALGTASAEPSDACDGGAAPPSTTPLGVGADATEDPSAEVCNTGTTVPTPAKGSVSVSVDPNAPVARVIVDGDSDNAGAPCTDGFIGLGANSSGPYFYGSPDGDWKPSTLPRGADAIAEDLAACLQGAEQPPVPDPGLPV